MSLAYDALVTERDIKDAASFAAYTFAGYVIGRAARRARDRRRGYVFSGDVVPVER